jgi:hypothetical protein
MNVICILLTWHSANAQPHIGMECYGMGPAWSGEPVSRVYSQDGQGNYGEIRYNYDAERTLGVSAGHSFSGGLVNGPGWSVTPMIGLVAGATQGWSVGFNASLERGSFSFSSADQLIGSVNGHGTAALYSWSEAGRQMDKLLYVGISVQGNCSAPAGWLITVGPELRLCLREWVFPVYFFLPAAGRGYLLFGVEREWPLTTPVINHQKRTYQK